MQYFSYQCTTVLDNWYDNKLIIEYSQSTNYLNLKTIYRKAKVLRQYRES